MTKGVEKFYSSGVLKNSEAMTVAESSIHWPETFLLIMKQAAVQLQDLWRDEVALAK